MSLYVSAIFMRRLNSSQIFCFSSESSECTGKSNAGETYSAHGNSFTKSGKLFDTGNQAKRIDYIMYRSGPSLESETIRSVHYIIG